MKRPGTLLGPPFDFSHVTVSEAETLIDKMLTQAAQVMHVQIEEQVRAAGALGMDLAYTMRSPTWSEEEARANRSIEMQLVFQRLHPGEEIGGAWTLVQSSKLKAFLDAEAAMGTRLTGVDLIAELQAQGLVGQLRPRETSPPDNDRKGPETTGD